MYIIVNIWLDYTGHIENSQYYYTFSISLGPV